MARLTWLVAAVCAVAVVAGARTARADGKGTFISNCAVCHQPDGKGAPGVYPPLADSVGRYVTLKDGRTYLIDVLSFGMGGKIESGGDSFEGDMPPWPQLSDEDVAQTLNYVLTGLNSKLLPADFKPISADEVKAERARQLTASVVHSERDSLISEMAGKAGNTVASSPAAAASPVAAASPAALAAVESTAPADGRNIFVSNCAVCHQPDGKGAPGVYPPLAGSVGRYVALKDGRTYLIDVLSFGMGGKIESGGDSFEGDMPPWPQLSDQDVAHVLTYVLIGLNPKLVPSDFKPISADEVKAERAKQLNAAAIHTERDSVIKEMAGEAGNAVASSPAAVASPAAAASPAAVAAGDSTAPADGRNIFVSNCAVCHQPDGKGAPGVYPPLAGSVGRYVALKDGRTYLIDVLSFGMGGKIESGGDSFEGDMPPWPQLSDQDVAHVLTYVLIGLNPKLLPADFKPISADEVKAERARQLNAAAIHTERDAVIKELGDKAAK